jgi:hypothetical protein
MTASASATVITRGFYGVVGPLPAIVERPAPGTHSGAEIRAREYRGTVLQDPATAYFGSV